MSYFSRLTEIVTCNLTQLLAGSDNPLQAVGEIVAEMEEGLAGARRSVSTAAGNEARLQREIEQHVEQAGTWADRARELVRSGRDADARQALLRKREIDDLIAGLRQQQQAAFATWEHLSTMQRALEARLAEAIRKQTALAAGRQSEDADHVESPATQTPVIEDRRMLEVDAELEALRRELGVSAPNS